MLVQKLENETSLTLEEMEMTTGGGDNCPGVQNWTELFEVFHKMDSMGYSAQIDVVYDGFISGKLQFAPGC